MAKKRNVFDIDFDPQAQGAPETKSFYAQGHPLQNSEPAPTRRGPMASAIVETAEATTERAGVEAAIRAENDALAHEHVRLKKLGLITDLIPTAQVTATKLTRDRSTNVDPELAEVKASIQAVGLSNPIRVEQGETGFELVQGYRRLCAFRELEAETGDKRYARIPAAMVPRGEPLVDLYRKMVDENMVRKDLSFGEMAQLALSYAQDAEIDPGEAVSKLYASALKQKRSYIRQFTRLLADLDGAVRFPEAIPRSLGLELCKLFEAEPERAGVVVEALQAKPDRDAARELAILRKAATTKTPRDAPTARTVSKTSLRLARPEGEAKVTATDGRVELRLERDFSAVSKARLQSGIEAFLAALDTAE